MPAPVEFTITMSALTAGFNGDPQELADEIAARLTITPSEPWSSFINGGAEPTSDVGPWLKLGQEWYVWDVGLGAYTYHVQNGAGIVDGTITAAKFAPGAISAGAIADGSITAAKLATDSVTADKILAGAVGTAELADGNVTTAKIADGNVTVAKLGTSTPKGVLTFNTGGVAVTTAAGTDGWVLTQTASGPAFVALPAATPFLVYPAQGVVNGQVVPISGTATYTKLAYNAAPINPAPAPFDTGNNRYVAPATGVYHVNVSTQCDNSGGVSSLMEVGISLYKNGTFVGHLMADLDSTSSPSGDRWSPAFGGLVSLSATDYVEVYMFAADGTNSANLTVSSQFSVHRVS